MEHSHSRPSLRTLVVVLVLVLVIVAAGVVVNQGLLAALATMLICAVVIGVWLVRGRRKDA